MRLTFSAYTVLKGGFDILRRKPHSFGLLAGMAALLLSGCSRSLSGLWPITKQTDASAAAKPTQFLGFDRNDYPGDATMAVLHRTFAFTGYWLTPPPEETANTWLGKRKLLIRQGWGFLVLANGKLDAEILAAQKIGIQPEELGRRDAATAVAAARHEDFPSHTILFLDQEEGGRMLPEQSAYILGWTEAVTLDNYRAGLYASGQPVPNGPGKQITTIEDVRQQVKVKGLHEIAMYAAQDSCPPAPGCTIHPPALDTSGTLNLAVWQFAQSPRRPEITQACAATYAADGNCNAPGFPTLFIDLDAANSADPSHGR
jgi:hypothetical protein